jgi:hypothetical protein
MGEMLQPGTTISYCVHEPSTDEDYTGTAPIIRANARPNPKDSHYIVRHNGYGGGEIAVYLDEVTE